MSNHEIRCDVCGGDQRGLSPSCLCSPSELNQRKPLTKRKTKMYCIYRNGRKMKNMGKFNHYERARQAVRKLIRATMSSRDYDSSTSGMWDSISRNPTNYTEVGFRIRKVA